jgi:hypothetical protein
MVTISRSFPSFHFKRYLFDCEVAPLDGSLGYAASQVDQEYARCVTDACQRHRLLGRRRSRLRHQDYANGPQGARCPAPHRWVRLAATEVHDWSLWARHASSGPHGRTEGLRSQAKGCDPAAEKREAKRRTVTDRVEVWRVFRQEEELGASQADELAHRFGLVTTEIVHDNDIAFPQRGHQDPLDIGSKALAADWPLKQLRCVAPIEAERGQKGRCLPTAMRNLGYESLATRRPSRAAAPWMRGAPHSGLSRLICQINSRSLRLTLGLPGRQRDFQRQ